MTDRRALVVLACLHLAIVAIVEPRGDFPLNDDWAFAHSAQWLLAEGRIRLSEWVAMNLVPQTIAGASATAAFGFSFETLRHVTQVVAMVAMGAVYAWFRVAGLAASAALVATLAVVAFPAWPQLANSYMTDLYGLVLAMAAAIFFVKALGEVSYRSLVVATIFAVVGVLQRQVVLAIAFAFMAAFLWTRRPLTLRAALAAIAPFVLCLAAEALFHAYLVHGPGVPEGQRVAHGRVIPLLLKALTNDDGFAFWTASNLVTIAGYLGLFSIGWFAWWGMRGASRANVAWILAGGVVIALLALVLEWLPPYRPGQVLDRAGIGPLLLFDALRGFAPLDREPGVFWRLLAIPAAFATAALGFAIVKAVAASWRRDADPVLVFCLAILVAYLGPFIATDYIDRYLLIVLPFLFVAWSRLWPMGATGTAQRVFGIAWIGVAILLAAVATRDYFSWNRARWDAIRTAERMGATADDLDGGFEYNGFRRFERSGNGVRAGKSWWWVGDDRYVVAFARVPGYRVVETWRFTTWLPRSPTEILLLEREK